MDIYQDARLITLNSNDAYQKLNDNKNSSMTFSIPNMLVDAPDILFTTCGLVSAEIPVSWYLIDSDTNILNFTYLGITYQIVLPFGNYTSNNLISTLKASFDLALLAVSVTTVVSFEIITGKLTFKFTGTSGNHITFNYTGSDGLYRILGFTPTIDYTSATIGGFDYIYPPNPLNLLGIKQIRMCSNNLSTIGNYSSGLASPNNILACIPIDQPAWSLINYTNKNNQYSKLKSRNISIIDIQLYDELGRFLQMNSINFTFTIQLIIFRKMPPSIQVLSLASMANSLDNIEQDIQNQNQNQNHTNGSGVALGDLAQNDNIPQEPVNDGTQSLRDDLGLLLYQ
jgi:hypothetical protein